MFIFLILLIQLTNAAVRLPLYHNRQALQKRSGESLSWVTGAADALRLRYGSTQEKQRAESHLHKPGKKSKTRRQGNTVSNIPISNGLDDAYVFPLPKEGSRESVGRKAEECRARDHLANLWHARPSSSSAGKLLDQRNLANMILLTGSTTSRRRSARPPRPFRSSQTPVPPISGLRPPRVPRVPRTFPPSIPPPQTPQFRNPRPFRSATARAPHPGS